MAAVAAIATPIAVARPQQDDGDAFEVLGVALEVGSACENLRGFEYYYLAEAWNLRFATSAAQNAHAAARKAALDSGADALNAGLAGDAALKQHAARYREKAAKLGCEAGQRFTEIGRIEAYKQLGGLVALILAQRGKENAKSPLPPLTAEEIGILQAFRATTAEAFGANLPRFEATVPEMAQQRLARYPTNPDLGFARFIEEQSNAFAVLYHESLTSNAGWTVRGTIIRVGSPFGYHTIRVMKDGAPELSLIQAPKQVTIHSDSWAKGLTGTIAIGRRKDGSFIAGLAGTSIAAAPANVVVKARSKGTVVRSVTGIRVTYGCPYARCFAFSAAQMASLVPGASEQPVYFFGAADASAPEGGTGSDGQSVPADRMRALLSLR